MVAIEALKIRLAEYQAESRRRAVLRKDERIDARRKARCERQRQIDEAVRAGLTNKQFAERFKVSATRASQLRAYARGRHARLDEVRVG